MSNYELIEKISAVIGSESDLSFKDKNRIALKAASGMLKAAADKQYEMEKQIISLQNKVAAFEKQKELDSKGELVTEVVALMFENGAITKYAMEEKEKELLKLDIPSIKIIKDTISSIPSKTASESVCDLTFLMGDNKIEKKESFAATVAQFGKK